MSENLIRAAYGILGLVAALSSACSDGVPLRDYPASELQFSMKEHWVDFEGIELNVSFMRLLEIPSPAGLDGKDACPPLRGDVLGTFNGRPLQQVQRGSVDDSSKQSQCQTPRFQLRLTDQEYSDLYRAGGDAVLELSDGDSHIRFVAADYFQQTTLRPVLPTTLHGIRAGDKLEIERSLAKDSFVSWVQIFFGPDNPTMEYPWITHTQQGPAAGEPLRFTVPSDVPIGTGKLFITGYVFPQVRECSGVARCSAKKNENSAQIEYSLIP